MEICLQMCLSATLLELSAEIHTPSTSGYFYSELISGSMELEKDNLMFCLVIEESCF